MLSLLWGKLRYQLQAANIRDIHSLYFRLDEFMRAESIPSSPCRLILSVPPKEWQWLWDNQLLALEEEALNRYVAWRLAQQEKNPISVEIRLGNKWSLFWEPEEPEPITTLSSEIPFGYFEIEVPNGLGAEWIPWRYSRAPRLPTLEEATADPSQLLTVLNDLLPSESPHRQWRDGECHQVCRCRIWFLRTHSERGETK